MMRRIFKFFLFIISLQFFLLEGELMAQGLQPEKPLIKYVTVNPDSSYVTIEWSPSASPNIQSYILATIDISSLTAFYFDTVPGNKFKYSYLPESSEPSYYTIIAVDALGTESVIGSDYHRPVKLDVKYDSCNSAIILNWNKYVGWKNSLAGYRIYSKNNQGEFERIERLDTTFNTVKIENILENKDYEFYVEAFNNLSYTSTSNGKHYYTYMPAPPSFVNMDYVSVLDERTVELAFSADISGEINDFRVSRSNSANGWYSVLKTFMDVSEQTVYYLDSEEVATKGRLYYYKVEAINSCSDPVASSLAANNIVLRIDEINPSLIKLKWDPYEGFTDGVSEYVLYKKNLSGEYIEKDYIMSTDNNYTEQISESLGDLIKGEFSYYLEAHENGSNPFGVQGLSKSNELIVNVESKIYMPNAFTPDGDKNNDLFAPIMDFIPKDFKFFIYDRSGKVVFQTEDPETEGWDGRLNGSSQKAKEGVYVYHLEYLSFNGVRKVLTGNVTLIYQL